MSYKNLTMTEHTIKSSLINSNLTYLTLLGLDILQGGKISSISSLSLVDNDNSKSKKNSLQKKRYTLDAWRSAAAAAASQA